MSYHPPGNPYQPNPYAYGMPAQPARPQAVTVLSVLCICFGGLGLLGGLCGVLPYAVDLPVPNPVCSCS